MHRCWLDGDTPPTVGGTATLGAEESAHVTRVLRMQAGEAVQLIAAERLFEGVLTLAGERAATVSVLRELPSPECPLRVTLVQGLPKQDKLELIVQKATELGAWAVLPVEMERSVAKLDGKDDRKRERLGRIALEAAKQSGRAHVPTVHPPCTFAQALPQLAAQDAVLVAWEGEEALGLTRAMETLLTEKPALQSLAVIIGPEGGIAPREIDRLVGMGAKCVTLGKRILRTETAGLCALAVIMSALGEM